MARAHRYAIGIDLGTSNCAMAYMDVRTSGGRSEIAQIPQWTTVDRSLAHTVLPSFVYFPGQADELHNAPLTWESGTVLGLLARDMAGKTPERVFTSAKSWLCHAGIDREARILPWRSREIPQGEKLSPIEASALLLGYLRSAWDQTMANVDSSDRFDLQQVVITVPASFDQDAQRLTLEAAALAGFPRSVRLLEEPQAAFYAWLERHPEAEALKTALSRRQAEEQAHVLVCDIGGGTTDLSLFAVSFPEGVAPRVERTAVSEHILLGGDNMDLSLAKLLESRLAPESEQFSTRAWQSLVARCRTLKEQALGANESENRAYRIAVDEPGAGLFAGARVIAVQQSEILQLINEGFFPRCARDEQPHGRAMGLGEIGLPYARDTAVTRHLARFLSERPWVDAVLFNGGTLTPSALQQRLVEQIGMWQEGYNPTVLEIEEPYLSVARGAAQFSRELAQGRHRLITAGAGHGFYLEISPEREKTGIYLVCVLPLGTPVEESLQTTKLDLQLLVNQPAEFRAYSTTRRTDDHAGQIVKYNERDFHRLPPLHTIARLEPGRYKIRDQSIPVGLESRLNALGLLQVYVVSATKQIEPPQRWELEFDIRGVARSQQASRTPSAAAVEPLPQSMREEAYNVLNAQFDHAVLKRFESVTNVRKEKWNRLWLREFWKALSETITHRKRGPEYEAAWLNAAGFFLRPGYGVTLDDYRIDQLWHLQVLELAHPESKAVREQYYVMWRRVGGGLGGDRQEILYREVTPLIRSRVKQANEALRMASSFEYLSAQNKRELFSILMEGVSTKREKHRGPYLWSLGRLLSRVPLYAGEQAVTPPAWVEECFARMKGWDWRAPGLEYTPTLFALACRKTKSRGGDVSAETRQGVLEKMRAARARESLIRQVAQFVPLQRDDLRILFGESLPSGLGIREFS